MIIMWIAQVASLVNIGVEGLSFGWRMSLGLQLIPACCLLIGSPLIPESPRYVCKKYARAISNTQRRDNYLSWVSLDQFSFRWHVKKNKPHKALKTLKRIFKDDQVGASRLEEISASYRKSQLKKTLWQTCLSWDIAHRWSTSSVTICISIYNIALIIIIALPFNLVV